MMSSSQNPSNSDSGPGSSGSPNVTCPWCPFLAKNDRGLKIHITVSHPDRSGTPDAATSSKAASRPNARRIFCPVCNYAVANSTGLKHHLRAKHGDADSQPSPINTQSPATPAAAALDPPMATVWNTARPDPPLPASPSLASLKQHLRVLPRVPQAARVSCARKFVHLLGDVTANNDAPSWLSLLQFAYRVLHVPSAVGVKPLSTWVKENVSSYDRMLVLPVHKPRRQRVLSDAHRARVAEFRLTSRGDLRGAIRLLASSENLVAPQEENVLLEMTLKHPAPQPDDVPPSLTVVRPPRRCSPDEVDEALKSFPSGSSGGLDGLTAQHFLDLLSVGGELRRLLLENLTRVCDLIAQGRVPDGARDILFGSWLVAASKPSGGLRPIAIGSTLRRLTAKILLSRVRGAAASFLFPRQLGFATKGGAEIAVHATRTYLAGNERVAMLKVDFKNAFNSHRRDTMLKLVHEHFPEIYPMVSQTYLQPTPITFGDAVIQSQTGCQQGDVLSPLLFCLVVHSTLESLQSEVALGYLDDFVLMNREPQTLLSDVQRIQENFSVHGLVIEPAKCELFTQGYSPEETEGIHGLFSEPLPGCRLVDAADVELLGAPIFDAGVPEALRSKSDTYDLIFRRLALVGSHTAAYILQRAAGVPRLTYLLRASPAFATVDDLQRLDEQFAAAFESILKISLSGDALIQLSLPASSGGMGIPTPSGTALSAFAASCYAAEDDVRHILNDPSATVHLKEAVTDAFLAQYGSVPSTDDRHLQSKWTNIASASILSSLVSRLAHSEVDAIRLSHASLPETGWWLQALPSKNIGTLLSDRDFILAAGLRLGLPLLEEDSCPCGDRLDRYGIHRLSCRTLASGRLARHNAVNDLLSRALQQAGVTNSKEPRNLSPNDQLRPDGISHEPWSRGHRLIWDVSVRDAYAVCYRRISRSARAVASKGEQDKKAKYETLLGEYILVPFVVDTAGVWGEDALKLVKEIGKRIVARGGDKRAASFIRQRIAVEVQRGNARMISGGFGTCGALRELASLSG